MSGVESIFAKRKKMGKKPTTLNMQTLSASMEEIQNKSASTKVVVSKASVEDDEWITRDKKKVVVVPGKAVDTFK